MSERSVRQKLARGWLVGLKAVMALLAVAMLMLTWELCVVTVHPDPAPVAEHKPQMGVIRIFADGTYQRSYCYQGTEEIPCDGHFIPEDKLGEWVESHCHAESWSGMSVSPGELPGWHQDDGFRIRCGEAKP